MRHLRPILTAALACMALPGMALASSPASKVSLLWLQDQAVDEVYDNVQAPARDIRVQVWHDRDDDDAYRRGETMQVNFRTNGDMYVVVYRLDVDGYVEILWPTSRFDDGFVYGNHTYTLPRPGSPVRLTASDTKGVEYIQAIASEYPFDLRDLGIDFRFDLDADTRYDYRVKGDPFLAVNDINFAITGLDEDVDYVVTDWTHLYVESKVDYARYTCTQCHSDDDGDTYVHPYVDTCTTVNVYADWGWYDRWYVRFGWYPLYYDPPFYYWDVAYGRPYWFGYYPIYYSWYRYPIYVRPYPVYNWHDSPWYAGDYRVRYRKGVERHTLYDVASPGTRGRLRGDEARRDVLPPSVARASRGGDGRVDRDQLVRGDAPSRERRELAPREREVARNREVGVREDRARPSQRRVTSLAPEGRSRTQREGQPAVRDGNTERRWTRPVIRNADPDRGSSIDRSRPEAPRRDRTIDRGRSDTSRDRSGSVDRTRTEPRDRSRGGGDQVDAPRRTQRDGGDRSTPSRERVREAPRKDGSKERQVAPPRSSGNTDRSKASPPPRSRGGESGSGKATPSRGGSGGSGGRGSGGGGDSRSRGNGGGGRG